MWFGVCLTQLAFDHWVIPPKFHPPPSPPTDGMLKILAEGEGLKALEIWVGAGGEGLNQKDPSSGVIFNDDLDLVKRLLRTT